MSKIQVLTEDFCNFLNLNKLSGGIETKSLLVNILPDKMVSQGVFSKSKLNLLCFKGILKGQFEDWGGLGIGDLPQLTEFVELAKTEYIFLKKTENKLICELDNFKFSSVLRNPQFIENSFTDANYNTVKEKSIGNEFDIKAKQLKEIINYSGKIKATKIFFSGEKKALTLKVENLNGDELVSVFDVETKKDLVPFTIKVSSIFMELLRTIVDYDATISMKSSSPIYVALSKDNLKIEYFCAPLDDKK